MFKKIVLKNKKILIFGGIAIFVLILILIFFINGSSLSTSDGKAIMREYEKLNGKKDENKSDYPIVSIPKNNNMKYINEDGVIDIFENFKDAIIYMGYAECLYCRHVIEVLSEITAEHQIENVYYLNTEKSWKSEKLFEILGEPFVIRDNGIERLDVPIVMFIVNGNIVSHHIGTLPYHNPYEELTKEQKEALSSMYKSGINDVLRDIYNEEKEE